MERRHTQCAYGSIDSFTPFKGVVKRKPLANLSLSCTEKAVILGGLLGSGVLKLVRGSSSETNACYSFCHSITDTNYFEFKEQALASISSSKSLSSTASAVINAVACGGGKKRAVGKRAQRVDNSIKHGPPKLLNGPKVCYQSRALHPLTQIHSITHKKNQLVIRRKWLNHLTTLSLAIWWFDNGSIVGGGRKGCLCTDGSTEDGCNILSRYLLVVWGVRARVSPVKGKRAQQEHRLWFSTNQLKSFLHIILPHLPCAEMVYKCVIRYKKNQLQQRWISHILERCPTHLRGDVLSIIKKGA